MKETILISGMGCEHCVTAVREALEGIEVVAVHAVEIGSATVEYDESKIDRSQLVEAVEEAGYGVDQHS